MDDYAGRVLADRYRLPLPPSDEYEFAETRAFDTYSGQEVLVRQVPLPETVDAEVLDEDGGGARHPSGHATRRPADPAVRRALEAAQAAAQIPDHPRLDQVFDVFAEDGSLWIVSEVVSALPLAALIADKPLSPYRAAEVASEVLTALRALHAHGWVHRNITVRTVLVCDDGRVMLTGLAAGAAEEALCGYDPVPDPSDLSDPSDPSDLSDPAELMEGGPAEGGSGEPGGASPDLRKSPQPGGPQAPAEQRALPPGDARAVRAGAIAAYRAGARAAAAARVSEEHVQQVQAPTGRHVQAPSDQHVQTPPGRIADPYGVAGRPGGGKGLAPDWHGATPRGAGADQADQQSGPDRQSRADQAGQASRPGADAAPASAPTAADAHAPTAAHAPAGAPVHDEPTTRLPRQTPSKWDELLAPRPPRRKGPETPLAAERARQARMTVVGAVTERWSPEQAGPVHENWQLAAPVGPATDLWALGALLFRAVQGHAPYPEDSAYELVQMVCGEPPAFAEECGPLRPVVESLLRQDPTERPDFEELRGWLRSLVRSAPEPEAGAHVVAAPPFDRTKLPVVRRRGELVRRRRAGRAGRHKKGRAAQDAAQPAHLASEAGPRSAVKPRRVPTEQRAPKARRAPAPERAPRPPREPRPSRAPGAQGTPRRLGRLLLALILLGLVAAVAYAMLFMPKAEPRESGDGGEPAGQAGAASSAPANPSDEPDRPDSTGDGEGSDNGDKGSPSSQKPDPQTTDPDLPKGFVLRKDPEGFRVAVASGWDRQGRNGRGQVVYGDGAFTLTVVPGRDGADEYGSDPMKYQKQDEPELQPYHDSSWATSSGLRTTTIGTRAMAEGQFTWQEGDGDSVYVRNVAMLIDGRYHVLMVKGPESERDEVTRLYGQALATYQPKK
ncbi:protein kinase [Streptomyces monticola]|uniref:Protein kinase n=1 Tax=Streptomyces monticola TaxID=2666263 RepID=A0ABW2JMQ9_9ACTN